jgi:hypothetical protein
LKDNLLDKIAGFLELVISTVFAISIRFRVMLAPRTAKENSVIPLLYDVLANPSHILSSKYVIL